MISQSYRGYLKKEIGNQGKQTESGMEIYFSNHAFHSILHVSTQTQNRTARFRALRPSAYSDTRAIRAHAKSKSGTKMSGDGSLGVAVSTT